MKVKTLKENKMKTSQQFFEELREGDEYLSCFMTKEVYSGIELELRNRICVNTVRLKTLKASYIASKELRDYEFNMNNK